MSTTVYESKNRKGILWIIKWDYDEGKIRLCLKYDLTPTPSTMPGAYWGGDKQGDQAGLGPYRGFKTRGFLKTHGYMNNHVFMKWMLCENKQQKKSPHHTKSIKIRQTKCNVAPHELLSVKAWSRTNSLRWWLVLLIVCHFYFQLSSWLMLVWPETCQHSSVI